jgi:hypothetical protein
MEKLFPSRARKISAKPFESKTRQNKVPSRIVRVETFQESWKRTLSKKADSLLLQGRSRG